MTFKKQLADKEKHYGFRQAVTSMSDADTRWLERAATGLTNADLYDALRYELGIAVVLKCIVC